ncbi:MAG: glycerol-3-phosphate 1-O-acyltransferase PlsY [Reyranellaceae bacterium]
MPWFAALAVLAIAYLLGSIPTGYLAGRLVAGIDVREHGSRSTGATNVLRLLGKGPALAVFVVDVAKGAAAILVARELLERLAMPEPQAWASWIVCLAGMAALLGHARSVWLGFTGGKSAATGLGVLLALSWPVGLGAAAAFAVVLAALRIVSLASMLGALTAIILVCSLQQPLAYRVLVIAGAAYVVARHRANIQRLVAGTEPRLGQASR